ncbi:MAG: LPS export ABC transporter periplasmic protein LptC [candidate division Zixibacteria bacterium]|nr:LPS export ABC transporter periplasmic protein LptC [candidate division Zixibacteria bacterium]
MNRIILPFLLLALTLVTGCGEKKEIKAPGVTDAGETVEAELRPDQELRDARISLYSGPSKTTDVKADFMEKYEKLDSTLAWNLDVYFYDSLGKEMSHLVADSGLVREQVQMIEVFGNVYVDTHDGTSLITQHLLWNSPKNRVETDSFVTFVQPGGDTLRGYGFEADKNLNHWKIKRQSSGVMQNTDGIIK